MKQFKFLKDYGEHKKGKVIDMDMKIYHTFIHPLLVKGVLIVIGKDKILKEKVKQEVNKPTEDEINFTEELKKKKMSALRKLGGPYDAKDTSKDELIEEIILKVPYETIKEFLEMI